jgi:DNA-directed RNA polymerase subunit F
MADADIILDDVVEEGRLVTLAEVKEMLEKAQGDREELTYEQKIALEHARRFARIDVKTGEKLLGALRKILPDAEEKYLYRVADLLPQHPDDVRAIFQKARLELTDDTIEQLLETVDKHYIA